MYCYNIPPPLDKIIISVSYGKFILMDIKFMVGVKIVELISIHYHINGSIVGPKFNP